MDEEFAYLSVYRQVYQDALVGAVVIPHVVRDLLEIPGKLAGIRLQRDGTIGVEIGPFARFSVEVGRRIAYSPIQQIQFRIVGTGHPGSATAEFPAVAKPALVSLFSRPWNRVEPPAHFPGLPFVSDQVAAVR